MAAVGDLDVLLKGLLALKPPGATQQKMAGINDLCIKFIANDAMIVDKIADHFKIVPNSHKLGVVYVVDSVTRKWIAEAHAAGQPLLGPASAPGTFASGVHRMTEILPTIMSDTIISAPSDQKEKIAKLVGIWEMAKTFPIDIVNDFKRKLTGPRQHDIRRSNATVTESRSQPQPGTLASEQRAVPAHTNLPPTLTSATALQSSTTPYVPPNQTVNAPPPASNFPQQGFVQQPAPVAPSAIKVGNNDSNLLLAVLQAAIQQGAQPTAGVPQAAFSTAPSQLPVAPPPMPVPNGMAHSIAAPHAANNYPRPAHLQVPSTAVQQTPAAAPQASNPALTPEFVALLQSLVAQGVSTDQLLQVLQAWGISLPGAAPAPVPQATVVASAPLHTSQYPVTMSMPPVGVSGAYDYKRSRSRSRSPDYMKRRRLTPLNRRESPVYGMYDPEAARTQPHAASDLDRRNRRPGRGRQSPVSRQNGRAPSPPRAVGNGAQQPKFIDWDRSLPAGHIRVLSRTLFVGGVHAPEHEIRAILQRFGRVQSCIVNMDRRHAFVKMVNRADAVRTKAGMEQETDASVLSKARSIRWGVGFGPRDCNDYTTGESVIPLSALTEADKKWIVSAEYGGTGGVPVEPGMVLEEPDIEIGAGVSSKAISRRIENASGSNNNHNNRRNNNQGQTKHQNNHGNQRRSAGNSQASQEYGRSAPKVETRPAYEPPRYGETEPVRSRAVQPLQLRPESDTVGVPPAVPGFGFSLPGVNLNFRSG